MNLLLYDYNYEDYEDYYKIDVDKDGNYVLYLYDENKTVVYKQEFPMKAPDVSKISDDIIQISFSTGNPAAYYTFFDLKTKKKSETYFNPSLVNDGKIVYMNDEYVLVVSDIFDKSKYYKEIIRNFSHDAVPSNDILKAEFLGRDKLYLDYWEGDDMVEKTETIDLRI